MIPERYCYDLDDRVLLGTSGEEGTVIRRCRSIYKSEPEYAIDFDNPMLGRRGNIMESILQPAPPRELPRSRNDRDTADGLGQ